MVIMSEEWLRQLDSTKSHVEYDGPKWKWPINKLEINNDRETRATPPQAKNVVQFSRRRKVQKRAS